MFQSLVKLQIHTNKLQILCPVWISANIDSRWSGARHILHMRKAGQAVGSLLTFVGVEANPSSHGVDYRLRLLKDLLLHEGFKVACKGEEHLFGSDLMVSAPREMWEHAECYKNRYCGDECVVLCWRRLTAVLCFHFQPAGGDKVQVYKLEWTGG